MKCSVTPAWGVSSGSRWCVTSLDLDTLPNSQRQRGFLLAFEWCHTVMTKVVCLKLMFPLRYKLHRTISFCNYDPRCSIYFFFPTKYENKQFSKKCFVISVCLVSNVDPFISVKWWLFEVKSSCVWTWELFQNQGIEREEQPNVLI